MNKFKIILFLLILASNSFAVEIKPCEEKDKDIAIKVVGFTGTSQKSKTEVQTIGKLTTRTSDNSNYERSYEIGEYRFVKENDKFITYRKDQTGSYAVFHLQGQVRVSNNPSIDVSKQKDGNLIIRRSADEGQAQEIRIIFGREEMLVKHEKQGRNLEIFKYILCPTDPSAGRPSKKTSAQEIKADN